MNSIKIIKKMIPIDCVKDLKQTKKCKTTDTEGKKICLIKVYLNSSNINRPITEIFLGCQRIIGEYEILKIFRDYTEALEYSRRNNVDIQLD